MTVPTEASGNNGWDWGNIRSCNYFLSRYQTAQGSESEINKYVAEVRFFRGLLYFSKVKMFGDVPFYDKDLQTDDTEQLYKARDPQDVVIAKVIDDFKYAIKWLPEKAFGRIGTLKQRGRTHAIGTRLPTFWYV